MPARSFYIHVPFCAVRCGYCDFNTYVNDFGPGADRVSFADTVVREIELVAQKYGAAPLQTVFFGGGTPTQLPTSSLVRILAALHEVFGLIPGAEVTTEANPDSLSPQKIELLAQGGFTRISVGMQSVVPHVLQMLDRTHTPAQVPKVVHWAREAGLDTSIDLIYGTPGETLADWRCSVEAALSYMPDHISAYSLVIESGTKMGADLAHGRIKAPDPDDCADKYILACELLEAAGYHWYEISNFARETNPDKPVSQWRHASRHNLAYWRNWDWWGAGPGAHSHIDGKRMWNIKHPGRYADAIAAGELAIADWEEPDADAAALEELMLAIRTRDYRVTPSKAAAQLTSEGYLDDGRLTLHGRLMADYVTRVLAGF